MTQGSTQNSNCNLALLCEFKNDFKIWKLSDWNPKKLLTALTSAWNMLTKLGRIDCHQEKYRQYFITKLPNALGKLPWVLCRPLMTGNSLSLEPKIKWCCSGRWRPAIVNNYCQNALKNDHGCCAGGWWPASRRAGFGRCQKGLGQAWKGKPVVVPPLLGL